MYTGYTVTFVNDYGFGTSQYPIAIGVDKAAAKSIRRHYNRYSYYDDEFQRGTYVMMINRQYCRNHHDFEIQTMKQKDFEYFTTM